MIVERCFRLSTVRDYCGYESLRFGSTRWGAWAAFHLTPAFVKSKFSWSLSLSGPAGSGKTTLMHRYSDEIWPTGRRPRGAGKHAQLQLNETAWPTTALINCLCAFYRPDLWLSNWRPRTVAVVRASLDRSHYLQPFMLHSRSVWCSLWSWVCQWRRAAYGTTGRLLPAFNRGGGDRLCQPRLSTAEASLWNQQIDQLFCR